ncbi:MAG: hypothetical protein AAGA70_17390 [Pseudomonadota bacterium]
MRTIILHYHLFKNAGTSLDRLLQRTVPDGWVTREFTGTHNTDAVETWIKETPEAVAFSSHTMMGPLPRIDGVRIVSVMLLRDPIARIRSAYRFERHQKADGFGATLAKHTDLEGYVRVRLALPNDRQCRNFQTFRLAALLPGPEPEVARATQALEQLSLVGRVERFSDFLADLYGLIAETMPAFKADDATRENVSNKKDLAETPGLMALLQEVNQDDYAVLARLERREPLE